MRNPGEIAESALGNASMMIRGEVRTGDRHLGVNSLHLLPKIQSRILGISNLTYFHDLKQSMNF